MKLFITENLTNIIEPSYENRGGDEHWLTVFYNMGEYIDDHELASFSLCFGQQIPAFSKLNFQFDFSYACEDIYELKHALKSGQLGKYEISIEHENAFYLTISEDEYIKITHAWADLPNGEILVDKKALLAMFESFTAMFEIFMKQYFPIGYYLLEKYGFFDNFILGSKTLSQ